MPVLAGAAWTGALLALLTPGALLVAVATSVVGAAAWALRSPRDRALLAAGALVGLAVLTSALVRAEAVTGGPVAGLASERAAVDLVGVVRQDPRRITGPFGDQVLVRLDVREVTGRGLEHRLSSPVLVLGDLAWEDVPLGALVATSGRLAPADDADVAGLLPGAADPEVLARPDVWWRGADAVRASIRESVAHRPDAQRALVPALVDGDDGGLDPGLEEDFRTTGLTHLTAVSGTNLTLIVGFLVVLARWAGVRGRWLTVVAAAGIVGFLLLARTEPSVVRAAAMGTVGLLALTTNGRQRALRGLSVAVVALLLVDPRLAVSPGFALSALATAGIVLLAPGWRDQLCSWLPLPLAEAIAVPAAAQVACTPIVAALSGQVSLVAVPANLLVAPVVGPATVLGLAGGLVGLVVGPVGGLLGTGAGWCVGWIVVVAQTGADVPLAAVDWGSGAAALALLVGVCVLGVLAVPLVLRRPGRAVRVLVLLVLLVVLAPRLPHLPGLPGGHWPGDDWVVAMCDVGQGDALVLRAGPGAAVVIDAGPDPDAVDGCLDRLHVEQVPLVVLTHFHADHVDGLAGVLDGRRGEVIWTTTLLDPPAAVASVTRRAEEQGLAVRTPDAGVVRIGDVALQTLWPRGAVPRPGPGDGSTANDASVVLLAEIRGVRILLTGDLEPPGQQALAAIMAGLDVDVLKVPHHGSRYQDLGVLTSVRAEIALVSVGEGNDYGHPAAEVVSTLTGAGAEIARTDEDGDVLVVVEPSGALDVRRAR